MSLCNAPETPQNLLPSVYYHSGTLRARTAITEASEGIVGGAL